MATVTPDDPRKPQPHPIVGDRIIAGAGTSQQTWQNWQGLHDLPRLTVAQSFSSNSAPSVPAKPQRVCVFAPHPDDEVLGCGGLLQQLAANGNAIVLVQVTNGTQSHPNSSLYPPHKLDIIRPQETQAALAALGIAQQVNTVALGLTDGNVFAEQVEFTQKIATLLKPDDIVITPFIHDGHPDHEATGQVVAAYAKQQQLACYQALIWAWHWAKPNDSRIPWQQALRVNLNAAQLQRKTQAIHCFASQLSVDASTGNPPILSAQTIARINQPWEVYLYEPNT